MKKSLTLLTLLGLLAGCNTMEGAGQDVKGAGQWTTDTARHTKQEIHEHHDNDNGY